MKDHVYVDENNVSMFVSAMPLQTIQDILVEGLELLDTSQTIENVLERLRIELLIRSLNL